jgi:hypothetical protein
MKPFTEYLAESKKIYNFKVKVAGELPEAFQENLKTALDRCKCIKLEKITTTPIQALPLDFPTMKNCEVHVFEVICEYPITSPEITNDVKALGLDEARFRVRGSSEPTEADQVLLDNEPSGESLLLDSNYKEYTDVKHKDYFGDDFNKGFLKDLEKTSKKNKKDQTGPTEYKLPKAKTDKTGLKSAMGSK